MFDNPLAFHGIPPESFWLVALVSLVCIAGPLAHAAKQHLAARRTR